MLHQVIVGRVINKIIAKCIHLKIVALTIFRFCYQQLIELVNLNRF